MCCECECGGDSDNACNCGGNLIKKTQTPDGRVKVAFYCLNLNLLICSCVGLVISFVGIAVLTVTGEIGALGFANWGPLSVCVCAIVVGSVACRNPITARHKLGQILYTVTVCLVISILLSSGIIILLYGKYGQQIAYEDSRNINTGTGSNLRVMANDRVMAAWNACCASLPQAGYSRVMNCASSNACAGQEGMCACYQDESIYRALYPSPNQCAFLQETYVTTVYNGSFASAPLVGTTKGSCGSGNPKLFQQYTVPVFTEGITPLGITYIVISCIMLVWGGCSLDMMFAGHQEKEFASMKELEGGSKNEPFEQQSQYTQANVHQDNVVNS